MNGIWFPFVKHFIFVSKQVYRSLGWIISISLLITCLFADHSMLQIQKLTTPFANVLYESLSRVLWPIAISYIIFVCVHNNGGPVKWFLSHPFWQPISNLSYAIYLVHVPVILMFQGAMKSAQYFNGSMMVSLIRIFIVQFISNYTSNNRTFFSSLLVPHFPRKLYGLYFDFRIHVFGIWGSFIGHWERNLWQ